MISIPAAAAGEPCLADREEAKEAAARAAATAAGLSRHGVADV